MTTMTSSPVPAGPSPSEPAIRTRGLTKRYGDLLAVDNLDLEVRSGEIFGLLGPNGAGKTTTILMLLGLSEPTRGEVSVVGLDPARQALEVKRRVGYVPDNVGFYAGLTGRENLAYTARLSRLGGREAASRVAELLSDVGLTERADDKVRTYSHGMRQRLGIADALVKSPDVLILDEPTIGLDPRGADQILELVWRLAADRGVAVLLTSHLLGQVQEMCGRVGIFVSGRMVAAGSVTELADQHGGRYVHEVMARGSADVGELLRGLPGAVRVTQDGDIWLVNGAEDLRESIATRLGEAGLIVTHLRQREEDLGQIYRRYFSGDDDHDIVRTS